MKETGNETGTVKEKNMINIEIGVEKESVAEEPGIDERTNVVMKETTVGVNAVTTGHKDLGRKPQSLKMSHILQCSL